MGLEKGEPTIEPTIEPTTESKENVTTVFSFEEYKEVYNRMLEEENIKIFESGPGAYKRYGYPELAAREEEAAELVGVEKNEVVLYNSGMAAIHDTIESLGLTKGDVVLYSPSMYGETVKYIEENLKGRGVKIIPIDSGNIKDLESKIDTYHPKLLIAETVGNAPKMPVVDVGKLLEKVEGTNEEYKEKLGLKTLLSKQLFRRDWVKRWLNVEKEQKELSADQEDKLSGLVKEIEGASRKISEFHSYAPLRGLTRKLEKEETTIADRRITLLELKSIVDSAWLAKREKPLVLILDNTIPTPTGLPLGEKIKKSKAPVVAVESGTKFYAEDAGTMGIAYSNSPEKILELKLLRMRTGTYLPGAVEKMLPEFSKERFEVRNKAILKNTKLLAETLSRLKGKIGIKAVSHPNLLDHPNYEYASEEFSEGGSAIFYVFCEDSLETAKILADELGERVDFGGSFGFEKTRFFPLPGGILRIAGGNESPKKLEELLGKIIRLGDERSKQNS